MAPADHDLLFGILALQNGLIDQADLIAAFQLWSKDRSRPLGVVLVDRGAMVEADRVMLESLVARHIAKHGGDSEKSLEVVGGLAKTAASLRTLAAPDLESTLAHLDGSAPSVRDAAPGAGARAAGAQQARPKERPERERTPVPPRHR